MTEAEAYPGHAEHGHRDRDDQRLSCLRDALQHERERDRGEKAARHPGETAELGAQQRQCEPGEAGEHGRPQRPGHAVQLVQRDQSGHEGEDPEPPAAEVDEAEHRRQQHGDDEDARPERGHLSTAEASLAGRVLTKRCSQVGLAEVRPGRVEEDELRIRELPEQEVRDALVAGGADQ